MDTPQGGVSNAVSVPPTPENLHPSQVSLLGFFEYTHLPEHLARVSFPFYVLAHQLVSWELDGPEVTVALRKLLEAKDCAVRAAP